MGAPVVPPPDEPGRAWWRDGVCYQIYPRSWADADGDGVGDLRGIIDHLDHLAWLGVDGIWLSPITVSPNADWGYDVADYCDVDPLLGTLAEAEELIAAAAARGLRVLVDLVPNHTSDRHPWFVDARTGPDARHRRKYVWADGGPEAAPPNNWVNQFDPGASAWARDGASGQCYLHNFLPSQPDLNWWDREVADEFDQILRFWFDRGAAGFRIDVAHMVVKDAELRDNPPSEPDDPPEVRLYGQRVVFNGNRPEVHDVYRRWRSIADGYDPPRMFVGETHVFDLATMATYYGSQADGLNLAFNFPFVHAPFTAAALRDVVERTEAVLPAGAWPAWTAGNHDKSRFPTRWAGGDPAAARLGLLVLLTLRGTPFLYYGDEIGMPDTDVPVEALVDPVGLAFHPYAGRDPERTPMPWTGAPGAGFTRPGVEPWLPFGDVAACNVADQRGDPDSHLTLCRDLLALRRSSDDLRAGEYRTHAASDDQVWGFTRGARTVVVANLSAAPVTVDVGSPTSVALGTDRARDGAPAAPRLDLAPWEGVVLTRT